MIFRDSIVKLSKPQLKILIKNIDKHKLDIVKNREGQVIRYEQRVTK